MRCVPRFGFFQHGRLHSCSMEHSFGLVCADLRHLHLVQYSPCASAFVDCLTTPSRCTQEFESESFAPVHEEDDDDSIAGGLRSELGHERQYLAFGAVGALASWVAFFIYIVNGIVQNEALSARVSATCCARRFRIRSMTRSVCAIALLRCAVWLDGCRVELHVAEVELWFDICRVSSAPLASLARATSARRGSVKLRQI